MTARRRWRYWGVPDPDHRESCAVPGCPRVAVYLLTICLGHLAEVDGADEVAA